jgi:uncharacterized protein
MIYCDTSLLVASLTAEAATDTVQRWLGKQPSGFLCTSSWTVTEFSSALSIKLRSGELTAEQRAAVMTHWRLMLAENLLTLPVPQPAYDLAARFADRHDLKIRAGDALHLAVASLAGLPLATLDRLMAAAALAVGVTVQEL